IEVDSEGRWTIPVVRGWRSENDIEANMALVGANALTMAGGWSDPAQLVELLQEAAAGPGLSGSGYNLTTLDKLLSDLERAELGDHTVTPNPRKPPRTTLDLMLTVGYHRQAYEGDPAVFHGKGAIGLCEVGIRSGWVYGTNSSMACCALADHWVMHRLHFLD